jgi:FMN phosphatase YigB (HAD superfamily)
MRAQVSLLICDLDNTLYDWVSFFSNAFYRMVEVAAPLLDSDEAGLLDELRTVHRKYHNSEQPFALLETEAALRKFPSMSRRDRYRELDPAFHAFNSARKEYLQVYPGVVETLEAAKSAGAIVVAHTEATTVNAEYRLNKLGLSRFFSRLYALEHSGEEHPTLEQTVRFEGVGYVQALRLADRKPDARVLRDILRDVAVSPRRALYVGDSISRDIGMANAAGVYSAWARYGTLYEEEHWQRLVRISHWTEEDVRRARDASERYGKAVPNFTLERRLDELLELVEFVAA